MLHYYWFFFALILALGRFAQLCALYMMDTPMGGPLVSNFNRFIWYALYSEIGLVMAVALVFWGVSKLVRGKGYTVVKIVSLVLAFAYLALSATNDEIMRWISQRLTLSYIRTYIFAFTDTGLVSTIFAGSAFHFILSALIVVGFMAALIFYVKKNDLAKASQVPFDKKSAGAVALIFVLAVVGCTSHLWFNPSSRRWDRIRPVVYTLVENVFETFEMSNPGEHYREGIIALGNDVALSILIAFQTDTCRHESLGTIILQLRASEVEISHEGCLATCGRLGVKGLQYIQRQYALEHGNLVDVALEHMIAGGGSGIGCTQSQIVAHDAAQSIDGKRLHQTLVQVDVTHVATSRNGHGVVVP